MKKIISVLLVLVFLSSNISFWYNNCEPRPECDDPLYEWESMDFWIWSQAWSSNTTELICEEQVPRWENNDCGEWYEPVADWCCGPIIKEETPAPTNTPTSVMGISCNEDQLLNGQCKLNIYDTLGIRKSVRDKDDATSVGLFVQDVVLSATFFIGTVVTIALIVSGIMFIFAASSGKDPANAKKGIIGSLIGLLLVVSSYVIIRLVQYLAKGF